MAGLVACMGVIAAVRGAYAVLAGPVLEVVYAGAGGKDYDPQVLIDLSFPAAIAEDLALFTAVLLGTVVGLAVLKGLAFWGNSVLSAWLAQDIVRELRVTVFGHLLDLRPDALLDRSRGDLASAVTYDAALVQHLVEPGLSMLIRHGLTVLVVGAYAMYLNPLLGAAGIAALPAAVAVVGWNTRRGRRAHRDVQDESGRLSGAVAEMAGMVPLIRAYGAEDEASTAFARVAGEVRDRVVHAVRIDAITSPSIEVFAAIGIAAALLVGRASWESGEVSAAEFVSFFACMFFLYRPLRGLGNILPLFAGALASLDRLDEVLQLAPEPPDAPDAGPMAPLQREVQLDAVSFAYAAEPVLREIDLTVRCGEFLAVVGSSGAGKTTLVRLLARLLHPDAGEIRLDGADARTLQRDSVRAQFAWVPQEPLLLADTILANIALGDATPDRERAVTAARRAGAWEFVERLPAGLDSRLAEAGGCLSGGQRQRLCIARALYRQAPVLLFDEPTSSLDGLSEADFVATLMEVAGDHTVVVVSHRLSTTARADRAVVLEGGRVVEEGVPAELWAAGGPFNRLFADQGVVFPPNRPAQQAGP